jgi:hypothetical protein
MNRWHTLVHVCRKWRNVVFGSPRRLELELWCRPGTPVRETLDVWPLLPIVVSGFGVRDVDDMVAALEHNDRIVMVDLLQLPSSQLEKVLAAMQQPLPAVTSLVLGIQEYETAPVAPDSFSGGSAPRLEELWLNGVPFPGLPNLLLSASHLVELKLWKIPDSGYISPEAMVNGFSALISLERLHIAFESPQYRPGPKSQRPPPSTRTLLPVLYAFFFEGVSKYLEDIVALIDAPLLEYFHINFFHQLIFETPQLNQFVSRTPKIKAHGEARVDFSSWGVSITFPQQSIDGELEMVILCELIELQLPSLLQVCSLSFPPAFIPAMECLYIRALDDIFWDWPDDLENSQWLELLHPFAAVKELYMSCGITPCIARALQELVGEGVMEVLPSLKNVFLEEPLPSGPAQETIAQFVSARQLTGHPIAVSCWEIKK